MPESSKTVERMRGAIRRLARNPLQLPILIGVSGGADSICLLRLFHEAEVPVEAAHFNFRLRGEESYRDQEFVEKICKNLRIPLHIRQADTLDETLPGESVEMTCRRLRYQWFREIMCRKPFHRLATGHNSDDNIETLFLNLLRGSGLSGLKAMVEDTGEIIRPLLKFSRKDILEYLSGIRQPYIVDSSNLSSDYRRNFLRNEIFPLLETRWQGMRTALNRSIELLQVEETLLSGYINDYLKDSHTILSWDKINQFPSPKTLIFRFIQSYGGSNFIAEEIARSLPRPQAGKKWKLTSKVSAVAVRDGLEIVRRETSEEEDGGSADGLPIAAKEIFQITEHTLTPQLFETIKRESLNAAWVPYPPEFYEAKMPDSSLRIEPLGTCFSKSVNHLIKEAGLSVSQRNKIRVLVEKSSGKVIWIPGIKRSRHHLISPDADIVYQITPTSPLPDEEIPSL